MRLVNDIKANPDTPDTSLASEGNFVANVASEMEAKQVMKRHGALVRTLGIWQSLQSGDPEGLQIRYRLVE